MLFTILLQKVNIKFRPFAKHFFLLALFFLVRLFFCGAPSFSQTLSGARLSDALVDRLKKSGFEPQKSPLSAAWFSEFPYNIELDFFSKEKSDWTLVLTVAQEDAFARENFIDGLLERINGAFIPCDIKILFTACDKPILSGNEKMSGTEVYCRSVEGAQNIAALALAFGSNANLVTPGSDMKVSPYYLTRFLCDCLDNNSCPCEISGGMFLSLYRLGALRSSQRLSPFLRANIPATMLTLSSDESSAGAQLDSLKDFFTLIQAEKCAEWSSHYIPVKIFSRRHWIEESAILLSVFVFTAIALFILADFAFLFRRRSRRLAQIKLKALLSNYLIVITAGIVALSFLIGQYMALGFQNLGVRNPMVLFVLKITPAFFIISVIYPLELFRHKKVSTYLYEYIISTSAILNIFIWTCIDISLFYIFALEYLILMLSRVFKRSAFLYFFIMLVVLPFLPLFYSILINSNMQRIHSLIFCGIKENILLSFAFVPFNLLWLRILARMNIKAATMKNLFFRYGVAGVCAVALLAAFSAVTINVMGRFFFKNFVPNRRPTSIVDASTNILSKAAVYDTEYYSGKIRRVEISCQEEPERCEVYVNGSAANPVYFSVYESENFGRITRFLLPDKPPKKLSVQYSPDESDSEIVIMVYFYKGSAPSSRGGSEEVFLRENFSFEVSSDGKITERRNEK